ncbi:extracellular solute-binding protein [Paenibacillus contaminans]|uniref:ABC transporter substrate-binding protein n=1 Tax=Paenibacillus contaminans TaxID=450362 RepID=A0A329MMY4_9BACL|nr:extracellular solute-binding protein [Paenibacillus contaminans]RAV21311.1 ABC transporter substrate-binding protein [Paenibacillus contaminans]
MKPKPTNEQFRKELEHMVQTLRDEIANGTFGPGQLLPSEPSQAERFGLSNKSVRKGLDMLVEEGLIEKIPRIGSRVKAARQPVVLTLGCYLTDMLNLELAGLLDEFQRRYSWITVQAKPHPQLAYVEDEMEWLKRSDLLMLNDNHFVKMVENGQHSLLLPVSANPDVYPFLTNQFIHDGQLYVQPLLFSPVVLCYNKRHFRELNLPEPDGSWTWDDLVRSAVKLSNGKGRFGFCFDITNTNRWPLFLLQSGVRLAREEGGGWNIRDNVLLSALRLCKSIVRNQELFPFFIAESNDDINRMFLEGKLSMILNTYMGLNAWKHADLEYDVSPIPFIGTPLTLAFVEGIGINKHSAHPEEARLLVDFMSSQHAQGYIRKHTLSLPSLQIVNASSVSKSISVPSRYMLYREMMFSYRMHSDLNIPLAKYGPISYLLKAYWANLIDEDELCDRICQELSTP